MKRPEAALHRQVAQYLTVALPEDVYWSTIGHGGFRLPPATAGNMKACGLKAGVPDVLIVHDGRAGFIELKAPKGTVSKAQGEAHEAIWKAGGAVAVCKSLDDVIGTLNAWGIRQRVTP